MKLTENWEQAYYHHVEPTMNASFDAVVAVENASFESDERNNLEKYYLILLD